MVSNKRQPLPKGKVVGREAESVKVAEGKRKSQDTRTEFEPGSVGSVTKT